MITTRGDPPRLGLTAHLDTQTLAPLVDRNSGNLAFAYATAQMLGFPPHASHTAPLLRWETASVFHLANYLGSHYDTAPMRAFIGATPPEWKMVSVGLGAQGPLDRLSQDSAEVELAAGHLELLRMMVDRAPSGAPSITVRGDYTYRVLERHGFGEHAIETGCPSLTLSPLRDLGERISRKFVAIGKRPVIDHSLGNPWQHSHQPFERAMIRMAELSGGSTHVQMEVPHQALARGEALPADTLERLRRDMAPDRTSGAFTDLARRQFRAWWDLPAWLEQLARVDFVFGSRIHGVALAIQAGTPAMCAVWDSRTHELCRSMGIPHVSIYEEPWCSGEFQWSDIQRTFAEQFDAAKFDVHRRQRAYQFAEFFASNGIRVAPHLLELGGRSLRSKRKAAPIRHR